MSDDTTMTLTGTENAVGPLVGIAPVVPLPGQRADTPTTKRTGLPDTDPCPGEPWDDTGAGLRFATVYRGRIRYVPAWNQWVTWDGRRWVPDKGKQVNRWGQAVARKMLVWAAKVADSDARKKASKAAGFACSAKGHNAMLTMASAQSWVATRPEAFDQHPDLLNCANGVVNLATGELLPHDPAYLFTLWTGVDYIQGAEHPDWNCALSAMRSGEREWFQTRIGQAATGHPPDDDVLLFMRGGGENGKSTIVVGIAKGLGNYARLISDRALLADPKTHPTELMEFRGARFAYTEELPEEGQLNVGRLKKIVGTPTITARSMHRDSETWDVTHSMILGTNPLPMVAETDHGTWRRLLLQEYPYKYLKPGEVPSSAGYERQGDPGLKPRIQGGGAQHEAALAWIVAGAVRWYSGGRVMPPPPSSVAQSTEKWRAKADLIHRYCLEQLRPEAGWFVERAEMYGAFTDWAKAQGNRELARRTFEDRLEQHDTIKKAGIVAKTIKPQGKQLSRRADFFQPALPSTLKVWSGVRFATTDEVAGDDEGAEEDDAGAR